MDSGDGGTLEHMTKLGDDLGSNCSANAETTTTTGSNLPNIISAHMTSGAPEETESDNRVPMNGSKFSRERQNSIYLSLLPPQSATHQSFHSSSGGVGQQNPNFDLISN